MDKVLAEEVREMLNRAIEDRKLTNSQLNRIGNIILEDK